MAGFRLPIAITANTAMKAPTLTIRPYKTHRFVLDLRSIGQGRKFFASRDAARKARADALELVKRHGEGWLDLSREEQAAIMEARRKLDTLGATIAEAANHYVHYLEKVRQCNITIAELRDKVLDAKQRDGKSERYLESLRGYLGKFCQTFGERLVATVTPEELDAWLRDLPYSPKSRLNFRQHIGVLFSAAKQWRMIDSNPIEFTARPKIVDKPPGILTPDHVNELLETARRMEPSVVPMIAIGFFAGLRTSEIHRLHWKEIDLARGEIEVTAAKSKSARRRFVPIQANLVDWLRPYANLSGPIVPECWRGPLERVIQQTDKTMWPDSNEITPLPHNCARHSYASYRLALTDDAPRVASELGHTTPHLLYNTYRALVRREDAELYWAITPRTEAANVVRFANEA
jgi:integrase